MTVGPAVQSSHLGMLRETVAVCAVAGLIAALAGSVAGHASTGIGLGLGLVIGSWNGYLIAGLLDRHSSFVFAGVVRMAALSAIAIGAALLTRSSAWSVLIGVGAAQLILVAMSIRQGLRA